MESRENVPSVTIQVDPPQTNEPEIDEQKEDELDQEVSRILGGSLTNVVTPYFTPPPPLASTPKSA